jgi:hypothetical protein
VCVLGARPPSIRARTAAFHLCPHNTGALFYAEVVNLPAPVGCSRAKVRVFARLGWNSYGTEGAQRVANFTSLTTPAKLLGRSALPGQARAFRY